MSVVYPSVIYFVLIFLPYLVMGFQLSMLITGIALGLSHFIIVLMGFYLECQPGMDENKKNRLYLDLFCQLLSIFIVVLVVALFRSGYVYDETPASTFLLITNYGWIRVIASILLAWIPGSLIIKSVMKERKIPADVSQKNSGEKIGVLERALLLVTIYFGMYTAAVLILVVKGIMGLGITKDSPEESERMIMGTFVSLLYTIVVAAVCFFLL